MNRDEIISKGAEAMALRYQPGYTGPSADAHRQRWNETGLSMYRDRFTTGLDAVEDDIRRNERARAAAFLRGLEGSPIINRELAAEFIERGDYS